MQRSDHSIFHVKHDQGKCKYFPVMCCYPASNLKEVEVQPEHRIELELELVQKLLDVNRISFSPSTKSFVSINDLAFTQSEPSKHLTALC